MGIVMQTVAAVPAEAWVGLLGVIFGSLLTTFGVWLTNKSNARNIRAQLEHDEKLHRQRVTKERLEELYILVCHWNSGMIKNFLNLSLVMRGHTDYNQYLDSVIALRPSEGIDFNRLEMILGVYGANLRSAYDDAVRVREKINEVISAHKAAYLRGESGTKFLQPLTEKQLEFERACDSLKAAIAQSASDI